MVAASAYAESANANGRAAKQKGTGDRKEYSLMDPEEEAVTFR